ncbi:MAG: acetyl-CoA carboxylase biotin carboxyl carrier protein subunit [Ignavibacteriaceae bacterium]|nr:acetyl-CoA carboxylase biotin carboxyl carrier protein subunit [Ignavibacteriaceae bacterium]
MSELFVCYNGTEDCIRILNENELLLNGKKVRFEVHKVNPYFLILRAGNRNYRYTFNTRDEKQIGFLKDGSYFRLSVQNKLEKTIEEISSHRQGTETVFNIKSPMPGLVLKVKKQVGDVIQINESVMILEAMKMENDIKSPASGIIKEILIKEKQSVDKGTLLFRIE